ncbi:MAG: 30S ribosomal protein S12 methylthiotransferase RimO [Raoultibacter sp.]
MSCIPKICFLTLGCAKNEVDSADMKKRAAGAGFSLIDEPHLADAVVVNTCSFIQAATEESLEAIFDIAGMDNFTQGDAKLIVAGCMPARYGDDLVDELPEACGFVPCSKEDDIAVVLASLFPDFDFSLTGTEVAESRATAADKAAGPISVYVKISDGCDRFCSFCTIPSIRGRYHSYSRDEIARCVEEHIAQGAQEIVLIAQDTGRWGNDLKTPSTLADLMAFLAEAHLDTWFRVMYIQPEGITDQLLACVDSHDNICSYFDIPLQHAHADLLKAMNRSGSRDSFEALIGHIRECVRDVTLRTTLIAGFPGESEDAFEELCDFLAEADFDYVGVFPYSREEGTRAADFDGQIEEDVKIQRAQILRDIADNVSIARVATHIGQSMDVLVLGTEEDGQIYGRAQCQAPDVDGVVYLSHGTPGEVRRVSIVDTLLYEMEGE